MAHAHPSSPLTTTVHGLAAVAWGVVPVWFYATGRIQSYLQGQFQLYALIGGLGLIVLGLFCLLTARQGADGACCHEHGAGDHSHEDQNPWVTLLLMILPILAAAATTRDDYSAAFVERRSKATSAQSLSGWFADLPPYTRETLERNTPRDGEGNFLVAMPQLFWSGSDPEMREVMEGIPVALEGKITPESRDLDPEGQRLRLYRLMMTCCAADATVIGIPIAFDGEPPTFPSGTWVRVTGTIAYEDRAEGPTAIIRADTITESAEPPPANPFSRW